MKYLGKEILKGTKGYWFHRQDNYGEVKPIGGTYTYFYFKGSVKEFYELSDLKRYIRKLRKQ